MLERTKRPKNIFEEEMSNDIKEEVTEVIESSSPAEKETTGPKTKNGIIVNSLFVKIRKEPSFESDAIGVLRKGEKVIILEKEGDFYKVSTSINKIAYVSSNFIKEE